MTNTPGNVIVQGTDRNKVQDQALNIIWFDHLSFAPLSYPDPLCLSTHYL